MLICICLNIVLHSSLLNSFFLILFHFYLYCSHKGGDHKAQNAIEKAKKRNQKLQRTGTKMWVIMIMIPTLFRCRAYWVVHYSERWATWFYRCFLINRMFLTNIYVLINKNFICIIHVFQFILILSIYLSLLFFDFVF